MLAGPQSAHAQSTWVGGTQNYRLNANWDNLTPPTIAGRSAIFGNSGSTAVNIATGPGAISPDSWTFTANSQSYTFTGADVNFNVAGPTGGIIDNANAGQIITIKNNIGGAGVTVEVLGNSTLFLTAANTYTGGTIVLNGTIQAAKDTSFGSGLITLDNATLKGDGVHNINIGNPISVNTVFGPASTVDNVGAKLTLSGNISGRRRPPVHRLDRHPLHRGISRHYSEPDRAVRHEHIHRRHDDRRRDRADEQQRRVRHGRHDARRRTVFRRTATIRR